MRSRWVPWALVLLQVAFVLAPVLYWRGGLIDIEPTQYMPRYLDGRSLLQKVFDPEVNDLGAYQARELSYVFDLLDAHVLDMLVRRGVVLLVPLSALAGGLLTIVVFHLGVARVVPDVPRPAAGLLLVAYLDQFVYLSTSGVYYRSGKPLLAPVLLALLFVVLHVLRAGDEGRWRPAAAAAALGVLASLLDRQGFVDVTLLAALCAVWCVMGGRARRTALALAAVSGTMVVYNRWLAPHAVQALNGYWPNFEYQTMPAGFLLHEPQLYLKALALMADAARLLFGSLPLWTWLPFLAVLALLRSPEARPGAPRATVLLVLAALGQWVLFVAMIARHPAIDRYPDHRLWYYPLPFQVVLLFVALLGLESLTVRFPRVHRAWPPLLLAGAALLNVWSWPGHRQALRPYFPRIEYQSMLLKHALRRGRPSPDLQAEWRRVYVMFEERRTRP